MITTGITSLRELRLVRTCILMEMRGLDQEIGREEMELSQMRRELLQHRLEDRRRERVCQLARLDQLTAELRDQDRRLETAGRELRDIAMGVRLQLREAQVQIDRLRHQMEEVTDAS